VRYAVKREYKESPWPQPAGKILHSPLLLASSNLSILFVAPYSWCINGNMGRVREKKRWRKEKKIERGRRKDQPRP